MYRIVDNKDGSILAVCFDEPIAKQILSSFPDPNQELGDGTIRYVYESCIEYPNLTQQTLELVIEKAYSQLMKV